MGTLENLQSELEGSKSGVLLAPYTTFKTGGPAELFYKAEKPEDLVNAVKVANGYGVPYTVIAGGNNVLVADSGIEGLVILNRARGIEFDRELARINSGENLAFSILTAKNLALGGLEELVGVPGTVGGAVFGNAGSFGKEMKDVLIEATAFDGKSQKVYTVTELDYSYRDSFFKHNPELIILSAKINFVQKTADDAEKIIQQFQGRRHEKQPLGALSCGSTFKNPTEDSAGRLIDEAGLKGYRVGGAVISDKHANFIINDTDATSADIKKIIDHVKEVVLQKSGVKLEEEVRLLGRWG